MRTNALNFGGHTRKLKGVDIQKYFFVNNC